MSLLKLYEERLEELKKQAFLIEVKIGWTKDLLDELRKRDTQKDGVAGITVKAETQEFSGLRAFEAALVVLNDGFPKSMHQREIVWEMFRRGWQCNSKTPNQTVGTALVRSMKQVQSKVLKVGRARFRLSEKLNFDLDKNRL